ncbi:MAG: hypothetical protein AAGA48_00480 [Myxococcota bacterium]
MASIPLGVLITRPGVDQLGTLDKQNLQVDGHNVEVSLFELDGSGLASLQLGLWDFRILAIDGTGLTSLPLGLRARDMLGDGPTVVPLQTPVVGMSGEVANSPLGRRLKQGGWTIEGYGAASVMGTSTQLPIHLEYLPIPYGETLGGVPYTP